MHEMRNGHLDKLADRTERTNAKGRGRLGNLVDSRKDKADVISVRINGNHAETGGVNYWQQ